MTVNKMKIKRPTFVFGIFLAGVLLTGCGAGSKDQVVAEAGVETEEINEIKELPKIDRIKLENLEGNPVDLANFKGKRVFLNLWATWCKPCIAEMPDIDAANKILADEDYVFLLASDEMPEKIKKFTEKYNEFSFQFVRMVNSVYDLDVVALPTTIIINRDGEIVYDEVGAKKWDSEEILKQLRSF